MIAAGQLWEGGVNDARGIFDFFYQYNVYFAGAIGFLAYLFEIYSNLRHGGDRGIWGHLRSFGLLAFTGIMTTLAFFSFNQNYEPKDGPAVAAEAIKKTYGDCLARTSSIDKADKEKIEGQPHGGHPIKLQCLALAMQRALPTVTSTDPETALREDVELGSRLLKDKKGQTAIADGLYDFYGINAQTFLGTGYSIPSPTEESDGQYSDAKVREYLVPNYCAVKMAPLCPEKEPDVWGWRLDPHLLTNLSVRDLLCRIKPEDGVAEYRKFIRPWCFHRAALDVSADKSDPVLIRFQNFPEGYYKGTVGRANAVYVFFSNLEQASPLSLREAARQSGSTAREIDNLAPNRKVFVWLVAPGDKSASRRLATWQKLFALIKSISVDRRIVAKVDNPA
jgi:hypothetical protein